MKQVTKSDLGINYEKFDGEQRTFLEKMCEMTCQVVNKALEGAVSSDDVEEKFKSINESLKSFDADKFAQVIKDNEELLETVKELTQNIEKMRQKGIGIDRFSKLDESLDAMFESEKYKSFVAGTSKDARGFKIKDVVSMTDNYTGNVLISAQDPLPRTRVRDKKTHVRDYSTVLEGDPQMTAMTWPIIYDMDRNARYVSENGELPESSFKIKEESVSVKRIGHTFPMSKRMLKSRIFVRSFILNKAVQGVLDAEDAGLLFGDGGGDMVKGITAYDGVRPIEEIITENIITGAAGSVKSVTEASNGLFVELKAPNDLLLEGMKIVSS
ncbi:MAG: hypothetical protein HUK14_06070 [Muribaculaceae bacterium]|nr:hypothetical protein [Muribaculaceae bacterium]